MKWRILVLGVALAFPIIAFADLVATSTTDSTSSSPSDTLTAGSTTPPILSDASNTTTSTDDLVTANASSSLPAIQVSTSTSSVGNPVAQAIAALEDAYFQANGTYLQILPGNALPSYEKGTVSVDLGNAIPDDARVDIYDAPGGQGYQISFQDSGNQYSFGYGPEATDRTYTFPVLTAASATSTAQAASSTPAVVPSLLIAVSSTAATSTDQNDNADASSSTDTLPMPDNSTTTADIIATSTMISNAATSSTVGTTSTQ